MKPWLAILSIGMLVFSGCAQVDQISDEDLAKGLNLGAMKGVKYALQLALRKADAPQAARIATDAKLADRIISLNVIPVFAGAGTSDVFRSAVDTALSLLKDQLKDPRVIAAIDLGVEVIATEVALPSNPAAKLSPRTSKALQAVFTGMAQGIEAVFPTDVPASVSPAPAREAIALPK